MGLRDVCLGRTLTVSLGLPALQQAALGLLELAEGVVHGAREVACSGCPARR